jgi:hypothetical protein
MAALSFTVIGVGLLSSFRPEGWWLSAWVAGLLPVFLGLASVVFADVDSSLSLGWSLAAIAWGVAFVAWAQLSHARIADKPPYRGLSDAAVQPDRGSTSTTPRWVTVLGIIVIVLALLFGIMHITGGGLGRHTQ